MTAFGPEPKDAKQAAVWRRLVVVVAAYRDRYGITDPNCLGAPAECDAQKIDAARASVALDRARNLADTERQTQEPARRTGADRVGPTL
jgi:hypothetical protein